MKKSIIIFTVFLLIFAYFSVFSPFLNITAADNFLNLREQEGFSGGEIPNIYGESGKPTDIRHIAAQIIKGVLGLLATIFLILIIYAGFKWMTSQGNEEKVKDAQKKIMQATIGLIIIMSAYAITLFITELVIKGADDFWIF